MPCRACKLDHPSAERCEVARRRLALVVDSVVANSVVANDNKVANRHGKYADLEARKKYMREYMAKRRKS